jgi:hypothetical protein
MTEDELLLAITEAATLLGWRWHHARRSDQALTMGSQGFPDLVLARRGRVLFLELKQSDGVVTSEQRAWLVTLGLDIHGLGVRAAVVRPADLDMILEWLR